MADAWRIECPRCGAWVLVKDAACCPECGELIELIERDESTEAGDEAGE